MKRVLKMTFVLIGLIMAMSTWAYAAEPVDDVIILPDLVVSPEERDCGGISLQTADVTDTTAWDDRDTCYGDQLSEAGRIIYEEVENAFQERTYVYDSYLDKNGQNVETWLITRALIDEVSFSGNTEDADTVSLEWFDGMWPIISQALQAFTFDHPEYFWIRQSYGCSLARIYHSNSITMMVDVTYTVMPKTDTEEKQQELQERLDIVVDELLNATANMETVEKVAFWDNWLVANNAYNHAAADDELYRRTDETPWSIVGALLNGSPVCEGYAKAMKILCDRAQIPCVCVGSASHMWNEIQIDGRWYVLDSTWNDSDDAANNYSDRDYFLVSQPTDQAHVIDMGFVAPPVQGEGYFDGGMTFDNGVLTGGDLWPDDSAICGVALYTSDGRLLACKICPLIDWPQDKMYLVPEFEKEVIDAAEEVYCMALDEYGQPVLTKREIARETTL